MFRTIPKLPLRLVLVVPFVLQLLVTIGLVSWLFIQNGQETIQTMANQLRHEITTHIKDRVEAFLATPYFINDLNQAAIAQGEIHLDEVTSLSRHFWHQLKFFPGLTYISYSNEHGDITSAHRDLYTKQLKILLANATTNHAHNHYATDDQGNATELSKSVPGFDARKRPYYQAIVKAQQTAWYPVYKYYSYDSLGVGLGTPIYNSQGVLQGILTADFALLQISEFLHHLTIGKTGVAFIVEADGLLIASSVLEKLFVTINNATDRLKAVNSSAELVRHTAQQLAPRVAQLLQQPSQQLDLTFNDADYFVQTTPIHYPGNLNWLTVVVIPKADFTAHIDASTRLTLFLSLFALGIAIIIGLLTTRWITQPLLRINQAAKSLANGQWEQTWHLEYIDELEQLTESFQTMAKQLKVSFDLLAHQNTELQRLDQLKDEFLANTSHELRTPLNGIIGLAESLLEGVAGPPTPAMKTNLTMIIFSGKRLASLVNDILDFAKLQHHDLVLQVCPVGLREIVEVVLTLSRPLVNQKPVQLINAINPNLPPAVADENRLQQIFHNLIGNAIKFTHQGHIKVSAQVTHQHLTIIVADTGIGIPEEKYDRIFNAFEQVDSATTREYGGTGLGLAVTKQLVQIHGGDIWIESKLGAGSRFYFTLPMATEPASLSPSVVSQTPLANPPSSPLLADGDETLSNASALVHADGFKVLIVDDEPVNLQVVANYLLLQHCQIVQATSGLEALTLIDQGFKPDAILLDVMMPKMTGYEVTQKLRNIWKADEIPIILLTAKNQVKDLVMGLECGANDYLTKPISKDELWARMKTHLQIRELQAEALRQAKKNEARLRQFLEAMPIGVFVINHEAKPFYLNQKGQQILGVTGTPDQIMDHQLSEIFNFYVAGTGQRYPKDQLTLIRALQYGESTILDDIEIHRHGTIIPLESQGTPIFDDDGKISYAMVVFRDITERKQAEADRLRLVQEQEAKNVALRYSQEIKTKNAELVRLNQEKNEFLGIAAHDLKNPLSAILGLAEMIANDFDDLPKTEIVECATGISTSATQMFNLIVNLLDVNKIEAGQFSLNLKPTDLLPLLQTLVKSYQDRVQAKQLILHFQPPETPLVARVDSDITHQVLENLISNAVKYSPPGKHIYIRLLPTEQTVRCEIQDEGPGLSENDQQKLFGKFTRLSAQPTGGEHSTGLGLFIVKKLVTAMNGRVWCESELGKGATFVVDFAKISE